MNFKDKKGQGATEYLLMLAAVLVVVASAVYYVTQAGGYPAVGAVAEPRESGSSSTENIYLSVQTGSIAATNWEVTFEPDTNVTEVNLNNGIGQVELSSPGVTVAEVNQTDNAQVVSVTLEHVESGHVYDTWDVTIPAT